LNPHAFLGLIADSTAGALGTASSAHEALLVLAPVRIWHVMRAEQG
jgi:hypothetical protein